MSFSVYSLEERSFGDWEAIFLKASTSFSVYFWTIFSWVLVSSSIFLVASIFSVNNDKLFSINFVLYNEFSKDLFFKTEIKKDLFVLIPLISNSFKFFWVVGAPTS